ncbi:MAG: pentapeptide repeat-containing protein [Candidatus Thiodiazotropha sp. (ex Epidulcina cf. delphinae)]|nr:pentapeptide repeat-containing protein [Candidatus Thiodiazotropha sp. (ex Epidulcina cf. delphinae)]
MQQQDEKSPQAWFVRHEGLVMGPFSGARIRHLLLKGELDLEDEVSPDKMQWLKIKANPAIVPLQLRAEAGDREAMAQVEAREKAYARDSEQETHFPLIPLLVALLLTGTIVVFSLWIGMPEDVNRPQCDAPPGPGVNWRNCLMVDLDVGAASLAGANLNNAVLRNARLSATDLTAADLRYANLSQADLRYAQLGEAILVGADLRQADLRDADLSRADLRFADLSDSRIDDATLQGVRLDGAIWIDGRSCGADSIGNCRE